MTDFPNVNPLLAAGAAHAAPASLPCAAGIGLKPEHFRQILAQPPALGFFEIHAENYMVAGGPYQH